MTISVILTTMNNADTVQDALNGLAKQTRFPDEIILVDSSSDDTPDIAAPFVDQIITTPPGNLGLAMQVGINHAQGDIIVSTDGDSILIEGWLEKAEELLKKPECLIAWGPSFGFNGIKLWWTENAGPVGRGMAYRRQDFIDAGGLCKVTEKDCVTDTDLVTGVETTECLYEHDCPAWFEDHLIKKALATLGGEWCYSDDMIVYTEFPTTTFKKTVKQVAVLGTTVGLVVGIGVKSALRR